MSRKLDPLPFRVENEAQFSRRSVVIMEREAKHALRFVADNGEH
jgi:hypothetical protein